MMGGGKQMMPDQQGSPDMHKKGMHHGAKGNMMEMCMRMMQSMNQSKERNDFATPELRLLFDEWCQQIENEITEYTKNSSEINTKELSEKFNLTEESINYLLSKKAGKRED